MGLHRASVKGINFIKETLFHKISRFFAYFVVFSFSLLCMWFGLVAVGVFSNYWGFAFLNM